jgi:hypothetical protein
MARLVLCFAVVGLLGRLAAVNSVVVIRDQDHAEAGDDFLRVSCERDEATGVFTRIERVLGGACGSESTGGWRLRKLFDGLLGSEEAALRLATAYAEHKGIPVVYAETRRR